MRAFVLGTAGHVDHGKSALVLALTGVDPDRWPEEKSRGLTIDIGFAPLDLGAEVEVGVVDVPGHEDFVKNMLAGSTGIDLLLLVVAADEGPMPQTREHLAIARVLGIRRGVVALTKSDRVEPEWLELARQATLEELHAALGHATWPVVPVSSTTGAGLDELRCEILRAAEGLGVRDAEDDFRMPIDRSFSVAGTGTVITGTVWSGSVKVGDQVHILPGTKRVRVRSIEVHGERRQEVTPGRRCALSLVGIEPIHAGRGSVAVRGDAWEARKRLGARLSVDPRAGRKIEHRQRVRVFLGTSEVLARVLLETGGELAPGQSGWAVLEMEKEIVARVRDRFVIRFYSPVRTIGGGRVVALDPGRRWRTRVADWAELLEAAPGKAAAVVCRLAGGWGVARRRLPLVTGVSAAVMRREGEDGPEGTVAFGSHLFAKEALSACREQLLAELARAHRGRRRVAAVSLEEVRGSVATRAHPDLIAGALRELEDEGRVVVEGPLIRLPEHRPQLTAEESRQLDRLGAHLDAAGWEPPSVAELPDILGVDRAVLKDLLRLLVDGGKIVALTPEIYLSCTQAERAQERARVLLRSGEAIGPAGFRSEFNVSRKFLIPILEYLDRSGTTRRTEAGRVLA